MIINIHVKVQPAHLHNFYDKKQQQSWTKLLTHPHCMVKQRTITAKHLVRTLKLILLNTVIMNEVLRIKDPWKREKLGTYDVNLTSLTHGACSIIASEQH